jgi:hypothetical protein
VSKALPPPSGMRPPETVRLADGGSADLLPLARVITERYLERFPDELDRYDDPAAVRAWCEHDNRHLLGWAALPEEQFLDHLRWLGRILEHRGYPVERLADDLRIAAEVVVEDHGEAAAGIAERLGAGAALVERTESFVVPD